MYRFFVSSEQLNTSPIVIEGADVKHIRNVLRMKPGDELLLCEDGGKKEYLCEIQAYGDDLATVEVRILDVFGNARELPSEITLFQGYPKGDKLETIVQKAVELGAVRIVPVMMKRCVVKLDEKKAAKKTERLNAIALSAAKQSKRGRIPEVTPPMNMKEAIEYAKGLDTLVVPYENAQGMSHSRAVITDACKEKTIGVFIGPEGGFESEEVQMITDVGGKSITLGHRILRTETAGMTVLSLLMYSLEQD